MYSDIILQAYDDALQALDASSSKHGDSSQRHHRSQQRSELDFPFSQLQLCNLRQNVTLLALTAGEMASKPPENYEERSRSRYGMLDGQFNFSLKQIFAGLNLTELPSTCCLSLVLVDIPAPLFLPPGIIPTSVQVTKPSSMQT
ncbi:hypothetical protein MMC24_005440 [Lignoscripta atroalba]|nr:hypothetical protein [Lignoscripta atroalba]